MKTKTKIGIFITSITLFVGAIFFSPSVAYALPYGNEALGPDAQLTSAPPSYIPERKVTVPRGIIEKDYMTNPEDMYVDTDTGYIYVADSGNKRIVQLSYENEDYYEGIDSYTKDEEEVAFKNPLGVSCNSRYLFVADRDAQKIVIFDKYNLSFIKEIGKPDSPLVGKNTSFIPLKVKADDSGNIYVVLEGSSKGVMQLDGDGNFVAYIGANRTEQTLLQRIQNFFGVINKDQMLNKAQAVTNIGIDNKGLLYTVTNGNKEPIKKLNTSGNAILTMNYNDSLTVSSFISPDGNIFSTQSNGYVTVYDSYGSLLFRFGGENSQELLGVLKLPVAVGLASDNNLLVLDKEAGFIVSYTPTYFASLTYEAVNYYKEGLYLDGEASWTELLRYNSKFILAYKALAKASMKKGEYDTALKQFKLAEDKEGYSEALWQIRDRWIRTNLGWVLLPIVILVGAYVTLKMVDKRKPEVFATTKNFMSRTAQAPVVKDIGLMFPYMRHPRDVIYEIKFKKRATIIGAIVLYIIFAAIQILKVYLTGYLFNTGGRADGLRTILLSTLPLLLLVVCNYYVSSVRDGEGKLKDIFISFIYALSPYIVFSLPLFLISNIVTYNEQAIYYMVIGVMYAWCGFNIVFTVMELHDYSLWKAIINILLTLVCFVLVIAFAFILYVLGYQIFHYFANVLKEVTMR